MMMKIGRIIMQSGAVIDFAAKELELKVDFRSVIAVDYNFLHDPYGAPIFINWDNVDAVVIDEEVEENDNA
jgi:hypothetical protein